VFCHKHVQHAVSLRGGTDWRSDEPDVRVARIFNTYGPRMRTDDGRVIPTFVRQVLMGEDLTVSGDGTGIRRCCSNSDLIDGHQHLPEADVQTAVNIGSPDERTSLDLAEIIIELTDSDSAITHEPFPPQDPQVRQPDILNARAEVGRGGCQSRRCSICIPRISDAGLSGSPSKMWP